MGWAAGSRVMHDVIDAVKRHVPRETVRVKIYEEIIPTFEDFDCDTLYECEEDDPAFAKAFHNLTDKPIV